MIPVRKVTESEADPLRYHDGINDKYTGLIRKAIRMSKGMPVGIQVAAHTWEDEKCLKAM